MTTRNWDLVAAGVWSAAAVVAILVTDNLLLRIVAGAPLLFLLCGHVLLRAIGLRAESTPEHVVLAVGTSIALCVAGGLLLDWIGHLTPVGWAVWLAAVTGSAALAARSRGDAGEFPRPAVRLSPISSWQMTLAGISMLITCGAYAMAVRDEAGQNEFRYTEFWLLYGAELAPGMLVVGIDSGEAVPRRFDVEIALDGHTIALWRAVALVPGATWTRAIAVPPGTGSARKSEAWLYRVEDNAIYRRVSAIIPGEPN